MLAPDRVFYRVTHPDDRRRLQWVADPLRSAEAVEDR